MKGIDVFLVLFFVVAIVQGYKSGFIMELFSLIAVILGILGGFKLMGVAMVYLDHKFNIDEKVLPYAGFAIVFVIIVVLVNIIGRVLKASVNKTVLGSVDQVAGASLSLVRTVFMLSVMLWIADSLHLNYLSRWTDGSWLYPKVASFAPGIAHAVSTFVPFFSDVF